MGKVKWTKKLKKIEHRSWRLDKKKGRRLNIEVGGLGVEVLHLAPDAILWDCNFQLFTLCP